MNREIKFRIWSNSLNRIVYNPYVKEIYRERDQINDFFNGKNNKFTWMQYTGLKDKVGKEIYEGDIIKIPRKIGIIEEDLTYTVADIRQFYHLIMGSQLEQSEYEVIGNIHDSPTEKNYTFTD